MKKFWLSLLATSLGWLSLTTSAQAQALVPYTPELDSQQLEQQGLELIQDTVQLIQFRQYEQALHTAELATQLAPEYYQAWFLLGSIYVQQEQIDQGIQALQQALTLEPEQPAPVLFTLGNAYFQKGEYQAALEQLQAGLELEPDSAEALFDLGNTYLKLEQNEQAIASYQQAYTLAEDFWPAINNIGLIQYEQGEIEAAIANWQTALTIDQQQSEPMLAIAVAQYRQGNVAEAIEQAKTAISLDPRYAELQFLVENLWGEQLISDTQMLMATPELQSFLQQIEASEEASENEPIE